MSGAREQPERDAAPRGREHAAARHARLREHFVAALEADAAAWPARLAELARREPELARDLGALLETWRASPGFLALLYVLPAVAWLALVGLVVPVLVLERPGVGAALRRAVALARADYVHALGSLATLVILFGLVKLTLALLLRDLGDSGERAALGLADLVMSPVLFLGGALLYVDQKARYRVKT